MSSSGSAVAEATPTQGVLKRIWDGFFRRREASILLVAIVLAIYFTMSHPAFLTTSNGRVISQFTAAATILAVGQVMLLISGEIDLSIGHIYALAPFAMWFALGWGFPLILAVLFGIVAGAFVGLINGLVTVKFELPSFVTTLGMLFLLNGFTLIISGGFPKSAPRDGVLIEVLGRMPFAGILWAILIVVVMHVLLMHTPWGVWTFAIGGNPIGAEEAGVPINVVKVGNFVLMGALAGFTGIIEAIRVASIDPLAGGTQIMFIAIAAAVIGGTALAGGSGTVVGAFMGAVVLAILRDGFTLMGISAFMFNMILGAAIIIAMVINVRFGKYRVGAKVA